MTTAARKTAPRPSALAVFIARAEARAMLWAADEIDLHDAIDELWAAAVRDGLVEQLGTDKVQQLLADAFVPTRDDLGQSAPESGAKRATKAEQDCDPLIEGLKTCADTKSHLEQWAKRKSRSKDLPDDTFAKACREADEKQCRKPSDPHLDKLRRLLDDDVSTESAWRQVSRPSGVAIATLLTAEFLLQQNDPARFKAWLARHSRENRQAILEHLNKKRG